MPRISAPTVAEHRQRQRRALLDGARAILGETGAPPTLAAVAQRAGLARSSAYHYFASSEDLLAAVVGDVFPDWASQVRDRVAAASTPGARIWAYVHANLELFASSEQAVASALSKVVDPAVLKEPMEAFHAELQGPLLEALVEHGEARPQLMAQSIDTLLLQVARALEQGPDGVPLTKGEALDHLHRLLRGYLDSPTAGTG
ncbi:TetR/AcrR family transcriptional regulator [Nocardioides pacificus]